MFLDPLLKKKITLTIYFVGMCGARVCHGMCGNERTMCRSWFSLSTVGALGIKTLVFGLGCQHFYQLSTSPAFNLTSSWFTYCPKRVGYSHLNSGSPFLVSNMYRS